ncbi:MAG TPA: hypothetical protein VEW74_10075, partial [Candidatus Nitrosotalea sp.]|nr:hypothetical protein [Candidatus Nitrosotalea sp.]
SAKAMTYSSSERRLYAVVGGVACASAPFRAPLPELLGIVTIDPATGRTRYLSGEPPGFGGNAPRTPRAGGAAGIAFDSQTGALHVSESCRNRVRKIDANGRTVTLAGSGDAGSADGAGSAAGFKNPLGIAYCETEQMLYVADSGNNEIRTVDPHGNVRTLAGSPAAGFVDAAGAAARFDHPTSLACDESGNVYVADSENNAVRRVTAAGVVTTIAGAGIAGSVDGVGSAARFSTPGDLAYDPAENALYVVDWGSNAIRKVVLPAR